MTVNRLWPMAVLLTLGACHGTANRVTVATDGGNLRLPLFLAAHWAPFSRADAVAIALREWRLFGQRVDDAAPDTQPEPAPDAKPERWPGLWQRVGEYWWLGLNPSDKESNWTGIHDENGNVFDAARDGDFAWSAAFISYVMRVAGAGDDFPYAASHAIYINAAVSGGTHGLTAFAPSAYAPVLGDLICLARGPGAANLHFADLPAPQNFAGHCDIVVDHERNDEITVVGGNVDDAVTAKHVPLTEDGRLSDPSGRIVDQRYNWLVVLRVNYTR